MCKAPENIFLSLIIACSQKPKPEGVEGFDTASKSRNGELVWVVLQQIAFSKFFPTSSQFSLEQTGNLVCQLSLQQWCRSATIILHEEQKTKNLQSLSSM